MPQESLTKQIERRLEDSGYFVVPWDDVPLPDESSISGSISGRTGRTLWLYHYTGAVDNHQRLEDGVLNEVNLFGNIKAVSVTAVDAGDGPGVRFHVFHGPGYTGGCCDTLKG